MSVSFEANMYMQMIPFVKYKDIYIFLCIKPIYTFKNKLLNGKKKYFLSSYLFLTIKKIVRFWKKKKKKKERKKFTQVIFIHSFIFIFCGPPAQFQQ